MTIVLQSGTLRPPASAGADDTTTGLKAYWTFASDATDSSGNGHNMTLQGAASVSGSKLVLTTNDADYAEIADHADFNFGTAMTCFGWISNGGGGLYADRCIISQYDFGNNQRSWEIGTLGTDCARVVLVDSGSQSTRKIYDSSVVVLDATTNSVGFTWGGGVLKVYIDGVQDTGVTLTQDDAFTTLHNSTANLTIGALRNSGSTTGSGLEGNYRKWRLYNIAKSATGIAAIHALGS